MGAVVLTCTPVALAVSGSSLSGSAAQAQYPINPPPTPPGGAATPPPSGTATATPTQEVEPTVTQGGPEETPGGPGDNGGGPEGNPDDDSPSGTPSDTERGTTASSLPFTGGPVVPLLLAALVLLSVGVVLRRTSQRGND